MSRDDNFRFFTSFHGKKSENLAKGVQTSTTQRGATPLIALKKNDYGVVSDGEKCIAPAKSKPKKRHPVKEPDASDAVTLESILWSDKTYRVEELAAQFDGAFPIIVRVMDGYYNEGGIDLSRGQVLQIHSFGRQKRVIGTDSGGRKLSIPVVYPMDIYVRGGPGVTAGERWRFSSAMEVKLLPVNIRVLSVDDNADQSTGDLTGQELTLLAVNQTVFLRANSINDGWIDQSEIAIIPEFITAEFSVAVGLRSATTQEWVDYYGMFARCVRHLKYYSLVGHQGILHEDSTGELEVTRTVNSSTSNKPFDVDEPINVRNKSRSQYENVIIEPPTSVDLENKVLNTPLYENVSILPSSSNPGNDAHVKNSKLSGDDPRVTYSSPKIIESGYKITTLDYVHRSKRQPIQIDALHSENQSETLVAQNAKDVVPPILTMDTTNEIVSKPSIDFEQSSQFVEPEPDNVDIEEMFDGVFNIANEEVLLDTVTDNTRESNEELLNPMIHGSNKTKSPVSDAPVTKLQQPWIGQKKTVGDKTYELMVNDEGYVKITRSLEKTENKEEDKENDTKTSVEIEEKQSSRSDLKSVHQLAKAFQSESQKENGNGLKFGRAAPPMNRQSSQTSQKQLALAEPLNKQMVITPAIYRQSAQINHAQNNLKQSPRWTAPMDRQISQTSQKQVGNSDEIARSNLVKPVPAVVKPKRPQSVDTISMSSDNSSRLDASGKQGVYVVNHVRIENLDDVPADLTSLSVDDVSQCLRLLNLDSHVNDFRKSNVDGSGLSNLTESLLQKQFNLNAFNASKLMRFVRGWRP